MPILSVSTEIKAIQPSAEITFIRQIGDSYTRDLANPAENSIDYFRSIPAGKFRRYHGVPWYKQALDVPMQLRNIRDALYFAAGFVYSFVRLIFNRPDVVFVKGGYVGLPVGMAASVLGIPLIIHESDTIMGLTNRVLSARARTVTVGMPAKYYDYLNKDVVYVGVPLDTSFTKVDDEMKAKYKKDAGIDPETQVVVITGGSQGAERINNIVAHIAPKLALLAHVMHQTGQETYEDTISAMKEAFKGKIPDNYQMISYVTQEMNVFLGCADVVVTRVGATTMSELAILGKPLVIIPNPKLVYGHQLKNAEVYRQAQAALVVDEQEATDNPEVLLGAIRELLESRTKCNKLVDNLTQLAKPNATKDIAKLIVDTANEDSI